MTQEDQDTPAGEEQSTPEAEDTHEDEHARGREGFWSVSEALRKAISTGYRAVASSEEGLRSVIVDAIPKELVLYMMRQADAAKDEVVRIFGQQIRRFLDNLDIAGEIQKVLTSVSFEIRTEIRFIPNDSVVKPHARIRVRAKAVEGDDDGVSPSQRRAVVGAVRDTVKRALGRLGRDERFEVDVEMEDEAQAEGAPPAKPERAAKPAKGMKPAKADEAGEAGEPREPKADSRPERDKA